MATGGGRFLDEPAHGVGVATYDAGGRLLDAWFPSPVVGERPVELAERLSTGTDQIRAAHTDQVRVDIGSLAEPPADAADVWLRLQLLSHRLIRPHQPDLQVIFALLYHVAWFFLCPV